MSAESAKKEEPAKKRDNCFSDRREVMELDETSVAIGVVALLLGSDMIACEGAEAIAITVRYTRSQIRSGSKSCSQTGLSAKDLVGEVGSRRSCASFLGFKPQDTDNPEATKP